MAGPSKNKEKNKTPQAEAEVPAMKEPEQEKAPPAPQGLEEDFDDEEDLEDDFDGPGDEEEELEDDEAPAPDARPPAKTTKRQAAAAAPRPIITEEGAKLVKKEAGVPKLDPKYQPRIAYELDKKGQKVLEDGEPKMLPSGYVRHVGYVNESGVLFPVNFRFRGGHVADSVEEYGVVLNKCPKCGYRQNIDEAVQGECQNMKSGPERNEPCGFSAYEELDSYELAE